MVFKTDKLYIIILFTTITRFIMVHIFEEKKMLRMFNSTKSRVLLVVGWPNYKTNNIVLMHYN